VQDTIGKLSTRIQLFLKSHLNRRFAHKVMGLQSCRSPNFGNLEICTWESRDKMPFGCWSQPSTKYTIRGKVVASPKSRPWWVLWVRFCLWLVLAPKVFQLCTNQLVIWFVQVCMSGWLLVILPSLITELKHAPLPPKCCELGNVPELFILSLFSP
jgi:hypothetical protein